MQLLFWSPVAFDYDTGCLRPAAKTAPWVIPTRVLIAHIADFLSIHRPQTENIVSQAKKTLSNLTLGLDHIG